MSYARVDMRGVRCTLSTSELCGMSLEAHHEFSILMINRIDYVLPLTYAFL